MCLVSFFVTQWPSGIYFNGLESNFLPIKGLPLQSHHTWEHGVHHAPSHAPSQKPTVVPLWVEAEIQTQKMTF